MLTKSAKVYDPEDHKVLYYYDSKDRLRYVCRAEPGTGLGRDKWQIYRYSYTGDSTNVDRIDWAEGTNEFRFSATQRASYEYS